MNGPWHTCVYRSLRYVYVYVVAICDMWYGYVYVVAIRHYLFTALGCRVSIGHCGICDRNHICVCGCDKSLPVYVLGFSICEWAMCLYVIVVCICHCSMSLRSLSVIAGCVCPCGYAWVIACVIAMCVPLQFLHDIAICHCVYLYVIAVCDCNRS